MLALRPGEVDGAVRSPFTIHARRRGWGQVDRDSQINTELWVHVYAPVVRFEDAEQLIMMTKEGLQVSPNVPPPASQLFQTQAPHPARSYRRRRRTRIFHGAELHTQDKTVSALLWPSLQAPNESELLIRYSSV